MFGWVNIRKVGLIFILIKFIVFVCVKEFWVNIGLIIFLSLVEK